MTMMLLAIFAALGVGVLGQRVSRAAPVLVVLIALSLTLVYFLRPMTMT